MYEPEPERRTDSTIASEPEPRQMSDQVREPATSSVPVGLLLEFKGMEVSPAHTPTDVVMLGLWKL